MKLVTRSGFNYWDRQENSRSLVSGGKSGVQKDVICGREIYVE